MIKSIQDLIYNYKRLYGCAPGRIVCGETVIAVIQNNLTIIRDPICNKREFMGIPVEVDYVVKNRVYLLPLGTEKSLLTPPPG